MKNKFKVNDRVRVVDKSCPSFYNAVLTIKEINPKGTIHLSEPHYSVKECSVIFKEYKLELVKTDSFFKSDFQDGIVVELNNGQRRMFFDGLLIDKTSYLSTEDYTEDLLYKGEKPEKSNYDIMRAYIPDVHFFNADIVFQDKNLRLIWDRNGIKEMTLPEIEKELGYKIIIKEE